MKSGWRMHVRDVMCATVALLLLGMPAVGAAQEAAPSADAAALYATSCTSCHDAANVDAQHRTQEQWSETVRTMVSYGAVLSDAEAATIVAYLVQHHGPADPSPAADATATSAPADQSATSPAQ